MAVVDYYVLVVTQRWRREICSDNKLASLNWCSQLLHISYPASMINFIWFTHDKLLEFYRRCP